MKILFVSPYVPSPIRVRPYSFLRTLVRRGNQVTLICQADSRDVAAVAALRELGVYVVTVAVGRLSMLWNVVRAVPGALPFQAALGFSAQMLDAIRHEVRRGNYDIAHIEHLRASALGYGLVDLPTVLDAVDSISLLFERTLRGSPTLKSRLMALVDLARTRAYEREYANRFEQIIISSPEDAWALDVLAGSPDTPVATVISNGVDLDYFAPQMVERAPATLVFSGKMSYHANEAAVLFLVNEIMPLVWQQRPDVRVCIAGSSPTAAVRALADDARVDVTGYLPDLRPILAAATIAVCPLRYGVGIQNKVLEAMAMATPVIAARQVSRALSACDGDDLVLAGQPHEYAHAIVSLLADPDRAHRIGRSGRVYVERYHNWENSTARLESIYREAIARFNQRHLLSTRY
ncbi:MAG TPA: glycosyltransferase [Roseiflexaceae bacterium]|nr:glycosyltransferase [Roseiflexaceae bacterium]HMP39564.1 glycosyltransferase [Roseiflexaceae bacterium]